ncbi:hypothetical protein TYRP_015212 [Tyrophagus putrescentiae]|nr:hypothetical protein TYRP_015212 [Tyrophagus putrescentiae]
MHGGRREEAEEVEQPSLLDGGTIRSCLSQLKKKKEKRLRLRRRDEALDWHFPGQSQHSQIIAIISIFVFFHHQMMGILVDRLRLPSAETVLFFAC